MLSDWGQISPRLEVGTLLVEMVAHGAAAGAFIAIVRFAACFVLLRRAIFDKVVSLKGTE